MIMRYAVALPLASLAAAAAATEPPDYIGFSQKAERLAYVATSMKSCTNFGYPDVQQPLLDAMQRLIDQAEISGIPGTTADNLIAGFVEQENKRLVARSKDVEQRKDDPAALEQFVEYWESRCKSLADDPVYGPLFRR